MGKIPGFKQFGQMKKLANMDIGALMGGMGGMGGGDMGALAGMAGLPGGHIPGVPKGNTPPGTKAAVGAPRVDKAKAQAKRKAEKAARKKNRR